jgi:hypothetical protein
VGTFTLTRNTLFAPDGPFLHNVFPSVGLLMQSSLRATLVHANRNIDNVLAQLNAATENYILTTQCTQSVNASETIYTR